MFHIVAVMDVVASGCRNGMSNDEPRSLVVLLLDSYSLRPSLIGKSSFLFHVNHHLALF